VTVAALTALAFNEYLQGDIPAGLGHAEHALVLAEQLGLDPPARTLSVRGQARAGLGDPAGLGDVRDAIDLAMRAGQARMVAVLHNNLALEVWGFEGPVAALEVQYAGIAFGRARGLTEMVEWTTGGSLLTSIDAGHLAQVQETAVRLGAGPRAEKVAMHQITASVAMTRFQVLRGNAGEVADWLDWLETVARDTRDPQGVVLALASTALARVALDQRDAARILLTEVEALGGARKTVFYVPFLLGMVRTALTLGEVDLAHRLVAGVEPLIPYAEHALVAAGAALAEANGDLPAAVQMYADAARRWHQFGVVAEEAFALLGQGRCLVRLGRLSDTVPVLRPAHAIFKQLGAAPALAETDVLLGEAAAVNS
jgi:hypothetical protein